MEGFSTLHPESRREGPSTGRGLLMDSRFSDITHCNNFSLSKNMELSFYIQKSMLGFDKSEPRDCAMLDAPMLLLLRPPRPPGARSQSRPLGEGIEIGAVSA